MPTRAGQLETERMLEWSRKATSAIVRAEIFVMNIVKSKRPTTLEGLNCHLMAAAKREGLTDEDRTLLGEAVCRLLNGNKLVLTADRKLLIPE